MFIPNPNAMGSLPNVPLTSELWKDEKNKYRHWVILFGIAILALAIFVSVIFILKTINFDEAVSRLAKEDDKLNIDEARNQYIIYSLFLSSTGFFSVLILILSTFYYFLSIQKSYKNKTFSELSQLPLLMIMILAVFSIVSLLSIVWTRATVGDTTVDALSFVLNILTVVVWIFISVPVNKIRRLFVISNEVEKIKNSPEYKAMQNQFEEVRKNGGATGSPFGPGFAASQSTSTASQTKETSTTNNNVIRPVEPTVSPEEKKLQGMSLSKLREVAKELSISGYESMKKDEIINAIKRITSN